jgi:hypothetical protein
MSDDKIVNLHSHDDAQLQALYQKADQPAPPAQLDAMLKQAARAPLHAKPYTPYRWAASIAASVIIGVLFMQLYPTLLQEQATPGVFEQHRNDAAMLAERARLRSEPPATAHIMLRSEQEHSEVVSTTAPATLARQQKLEAAAPAEHAPVAIAVTQSTDDMSDAAESERAFAQELRTNLAARTASPSAANMASQAPPATTVTVQHAVIDSTASNEQKAANDPTMQLRKIIELLDQGKQQDAETAWRQFRQQYPDYAIPESMQKSLAIFLDLGR